MRYLDMSLLNNKTSDIKMNSRQSNFYVKDFVSKTFAYQIKKHRNVILY